MIIIILINNIIVVGGVSDAITIHHTHTRCMETRVEDGHVVR